MNLLKLSLSLLFLAPIGVQAQTVQQPGYSHSNTCYSNKYPEEYVPGNAVNPGYVVRTNHRVAVPCDGQPGIQHQTHIDNNSCAEGTVVGAIFGGILGNELSRGDGKVTGIGLGAVTGGLIDCQVDGA